MAGRPLHSDRLPERLARLMAGLTLFGISISLMISARLGVDSWDVFHQGLSDRLGTSLGWVINAASVGVLLLWIPLRQRPGIGTLANAVVVGVVTDLTLAVLPEPRSGVVQVGFLSLGILLNAIATGAYIGAGLGPGPRDGLMTGLARRTGRSIRLVRTTIEVTVVGLGWMLGGPVGVGTVLYAASIGPLTQFFLSALSIRPQGTDGASRTATLTPRPGCDRAAVGIVGCRI